jgi:hypothetical protein
VQADADASKEKQVSESVIPIIEGNIADTKCRSGGIPFNNLDPLTDGTLKPGNPDVYYSTRPEQLRRKVRDKLPGQIIPSTQHDLPIAPNFFLAVKGPEGSLAVAGRQACYDGTLGARGMQSLHSYGEEESTYNNSASTITSIYHGGTLKIYTNHIVEPKNPKSRPEYHMTQLRSFAITDTADTFRQGAAAYRNLSDWAKRQRDEAVSRANERAKSVEPKAPGDADASPASSFLTVTAEAYTMSQESWTSLNDDSNKLVNFKESDSPIEDLSDYTLPIKRPSQGSKHQQFQRKRHNAEIPNNSVTPNSQDSVASNRKR